MELGFSHVIIAVLAFILGRVLHRKPSLAATGPKRSSHPAPGASPPSADTEPPAISLGQRVFALVFTGAWLVGWTVGVFFGFATFVATFGESLLVTLFLGAWTVGAASAWVYVAWNWLRMLAGHPVAFGGLRRIPRGQ